MQSESDNRMHDQLQVGTPISCLNCGQSHNLCMHLGIMIGGKNINRRNTVAESHLRMAFDTKSLLNQSVSGVGPTLLQRLSISQD